MGILERVMEMKLITISVKANLCLLNPALLIDFNSTGIGPCSPWSIIKSILPEIGGASKVTGNYLSNNMPMLVKYLATRSSKADPHPKIRASLGTIV